MNTQTKIKESSVVSLPLQTWTSVLVKSDSLKRCLQDADIKNAYLNGKLELLLHELSEFVSVNENLLASKEFDSLKRIIRKHTTTLDTYKNSDINAFVPQNIHE